MDSSLREPKHSHNRLHINSHRVSTHGCTGHVIRILVYNDQNNGLSLREPKHSHKRLHINSHRVSTHGCTGHVIRMLVYNDQNNGLSLREPKHSHNRLHTMCLFVWFIWSEAMSAVSKTSLTPSFICALHSKKAEMFILSAND